MPTFRKKPVEVEAIPILGDYAVIQEFAGDAFLSWDAFGITVRTLEGDMRGQAGDWLIRGVNGEIYPCKRDIFHKTYEPVEAEKE